MAFAPARAISLACVDTMSGLTRGIEAFQKDSGQNGRPVGRCQVDKLGAARALSLGVSVAHVEGRVALLKAQAGGFQ
jgi:hypothetical protein